MLIVKDINQYYGGSQNWTPPEVACGHLPPGGNRCGPAKPVPRRCLKESA